MATIQLHIELLLVLAIVVLLVGWAIWYRITKWWAKRKYNPNEDKSKQAEDNRKEQFARGEPKTPNPVVSSSGPDKPSEPRILPVSDAGPVRKNRKRSRGIFAKRRRR